MQHVAHTQIYRVELLANGSYVLPAGGEQFEILRASGDVHISGDGFGQVGVLKVGQGLKRGFTSLTLTDRSGAANVIDVLVGGSDFIDKRISGEVSVIDDGRARTLAGDEFVGFAEAPIVAAQFSATQWVNTSTTVRMVVTEFMAMINGGSTNAYFGTNPGAGAGTAVTGVARNKRVAAGASLIEQRLGAAATSAGVVTAGFQINGKIFSGLIVKPSTPWVIDPGRAFAILSAATDSAIAATIHFREEVI